MSADQLSPGVIAEHVPLAPLTTYRIGGAARWFAEPVDEAQLSGVLDAAGELAAPVVVLGRGSNVVVSDRGVEALVIHLGSGFAGIDLVDGAVVVAGAGAPLPRVARFSVDHDRGGLEFLVGVPGSVGGAVRMNAGCLGSDTADRLLDARVLDIATRSVATSTPRDLRMGYRTTAVGDDRVVLSARLRTFARPGAEGRRRLREVTRWRRDNQPGGTLNAGSVFKNPPGDSAGRLIDAAGLKGLTVGGARVSPRHANFFEAAEGTAAQDVFDLVAEVSRRIAEETGVVLEPELRFLGDFSGTRGR